jgi:DNA-binding NarL/FixJ family response regulator
MGPRPTTRNVLIVEDDDDIRMLVHSWLEADARSGMIWEASDPLTASALAQILPVDVVILDFLLAAGTAADCLPDLRRHRPDARIIVYAASMDVARAAHVHELGADHLVPKMEVVVEGVVGIAFGGHARPEIPAAS